MLLLAAFGVDDVAPGMATLPDQVDAGQELVAAAVLVLVEEVEGAQGRPVVRLGHEAVFRLEDPGESDPVLEEGQGLLVLAHDAVAVGVLRVHDVDLEVGPRAESELLLHRQAHLVAVLVEHELRGLAGLEGTLVGGLVGEDQVGEAGPVEAFDLLLGDEAAVGVELDGHALALGARHDGHEVGVEHGLAHLVELHRVEGAEPGALLRDLVEEPEDLLLLHEPAAPLHDVVGAPCALEVAGVRDLDEQVVDRVEASGQLFELGQWRHRGEERGVLGLLEAHPHAGNPKVAPELEAEGGSLVLGAGGVEVGQLEEGAAEAVEAGRVSAPALSGVLVEAVRGGGAVTRGVLQAELAETVAVVLDLDVEAFSDPREKVCGQDEVEIVRSLVGSETEPAPDVHDVPDPVPRAGNPDGAAWSLGGDHDLGPILSWKEAREGGGEAGKARAHGSASAPARKVEAMRSYQRETLGKTSSRASKLRE